MKVLSIDDDLGRKKKTQCREGCMAGGCDGFGARLLKLHGGCVCFKIATVDKVSCFSYSYCTQQNGSKTQLNSLSIPGKKKKGRDLFAWQAGTNPKELIAADQLRWLATHHSISRADWLQGDKCSHKTAPPVQAGP